MYVKKVFEIHYWKLYKNEQLSYLCIKNVDTYNENDVKTKHIVNTSINLSK